MLFYTDKARQNAIDCTTELVHKLAELKPQDNFNNDDIRATIMYLQRMQGELKNEFGK